MKFSPNPAKLQTSSYDDVVVGDTLRAVYSRGLGLDGDYGFDDAAMFSVAPSWARRNIDDLPAIACAEVNGGSLVARSIGRALEGHIAGIELTAENWRSDYVIDIDNGDATAPGDSGMLWRKPSGEGVAIHAVGLDPRPDGSTPRSLGMSFTRAVKGLGLSEMELIAPPT